MIDDAISELAPMVGVTAACEAVGRPRATHYRWHRKSPPPPKPVRVPAPQPRALDETERKEVLRVRRCLQPDDLHSRSPGKSFFEVRVQSRSRIWRFFSWNSSSVITPAS